MNPVHKLREHHVALRSVQPLNMLIGRLGIRTFVHFYRIGSKTALDLWKDLWEEFHSMKFMLRSRLVCLFTHSKGFLTVFGPKSLTQPGLADRYHPLAGWSGRQLAELKSLIFSFTRLPIGTVRRVQSSVQADTANASAVFGVDFLESPCDKANLLEIL